MSGVTDETCVATGTYHAIVASLATACLLLFCTSAWAWIVYKKSRALDLKNRLADGGSESSSTAYLSQSGPWLVSGHGKPQQQRLHHHQQQRYLPGLDHHQEQRQHRDRSYRANFADPSEPIYTDPSLFER